MDYHGRMSTALWTASAAVHTDALSSISWIASIHDRENDMTLEQLQTQHAEMIATAHDLGMNVPDDLKQDFRTVEAGSAVVDSLNALIVAWREKLPRAQGGTPPEKGETATEKRLRLKAEREKAGIANVAGKAQGADPKKKSAGAKVAPAKPEKEAVVAKKAAKKKVAKKKGNGASPIGRSKYTDEMTISAKHKDMMSTARTGTGWHDRLAAIKAAVGKKVAAFKGSRGDLKVAVDKGLITVK